MRRRSAATPSDARLKRYVTGLVVATAAVLAASAAVLHHPSSVQTGTTLVVALTAAGFLAAHVGLATTREWHFFTLAEIPVVLGAALLPAPLALVAVTAGSLVAHVVLQRRRGLAGLTTVCGDVLACAGALAAARATGWSDARPGLGQDVWGVALLAAVTSVVSAAVVSGGIAHAEGRTWPRAWRAAARTQGWALLVSATSALALLRVARHGLPALEAALVPAALLALLSSRHVQERRRRLLLDRVLEHVNDLNAILEPSPLQEALLAAALDVTGATEAELRAEPPGESELGVRLMRRTEPDSWLVVRTGVRRAAGQRHELALLAPLAAAASTALDNAELHAQLRRQTTRDALTGLLNQGSFLEAVDHELATSERDGTRTGVLFLDLNGFKEVNDTYGHQAGDELLRQVASRLATVFRHADVPARMGGDEFAVLVPHLTEQAEVTLACERAREAFAAPFDVAEGAVVITPSIGTAVFPDDAEDVRALLHSADTTMLADKRSRRSRHPAGTLE